MHAHVNQSISAWACAPRTYRPNRYTESACELATRCRCGLSVVLNIHLFEALHSVCQQNERGLKPGRSYLFSKLLPCASACFFQCKIRDRGFRPDPCICSRCASMRSSSPIRALLQHPYSYIGRPGLYRCRLTVLRFFEPCKVR